MNVDEMTDHEKVVLYVQTYGQPGWDAGQVESFLNFIPPCRVRLTRDGTTTDGIALAAHFAGLDDDARRDLINACVPRDGPYR